MDRSEMAQTCYSYTPRELAEALGISVPNHAWVVVEVDADGNPAQVDVMIRRRTA